MERNESNTETDTNRKRRTILKGIGVAGLGGTFGVGQAAGRGGQRLDARGPPKNEYQEPSDTPGGCRPETCDCPEDTFIAKYEFDEGNCEFVFEKGEDVIEITVTDTKDDDDCEPIAINYTVAGYEVGEVCAFGGTDTITDDDPDGTFDKELTNPGGEQAAISNITFCGEEAEEPEPERICFQGDLVGGEPIEEFESEDEGYAAEGRLLDFLFACSDDEQRSKGDDEGFWGTTGSASVDGESCHFDWDAFVFDPDTQELTAENLTLTWTSSETGECMASVAAYAIAPEHAENGESGDLTEQEIIAAETITLEVGETRTVTLDLKAAPVVESETRVYPPKDIPFPFMTY